MRISGTDVTLKLWNCTFFWYPQPAMKRLMFLFIQTRNRGSYVVYPGYLRVSWFHLHTDDRRTPLNVCVTGESFDDKNPTKFAYKKKYRVYMVYTEGAWNWHLQLGVGEFPRSTGRSTEKCLTMCESRWGEWKSYEISLKSYPPWNYHSPWKRIVGRWSLLSGWSFFKGYISFRECTACVAIGNPKIPESLG